MINLQMEILLLLKKKKNHHNKIIIASDNCAPRISTEGIELSSTLIIFWEKVSHSECFFKSNKMRDRKVKGKERKWERERERIKGIC